MKKYFIAGYMLSLILFFLCLGACKGHSSQNTNSDTATTTTTTPVDNTTKKNPDTVIVSGDDSLRNMISDAVKDYPGVTVAVDQGVITLTGNITREKLPKLMMAINSLHPKKVNNNLTIK
jgi:type IV pilus biogenesis protein CpaD/CtpE